MIPFTGLLAWRRPAPLPPGPVPPATTERERTAEGLDVTVFGDWPGTYYPAAVNRGGGGVP